MSGDGINEWYHYMLLFKLENSLVHTAVHFYYYFILQSIHAFKGLILVESELYIFQIKYWMIAITSTCLKSIVKKSKEEDNKITAGIVFKLCTQIPIFLL